MATTVSCACAASSNPNRGGALSKSMALRCAMGRRGAEEKIRFTRRSAEVGTADE